ncbi:hypothetical protein GGF40_003250, partial [Coemansia sp. RSA 1286]
PWFSSRSRNSTTSTRSPPVCTCSSLGKSILSTALSVPALPLLPIRPSTTFRHRAWVFCSSCQSTAH